MRADSILKLSLAAGALLAGAGIGYYYGIFLPGEAIRETVAAGERHQAEAAARQASFERARAAEAQRQEAAQVQYQTCLATADDSYHTRWTQACGIQHARQQAAFEDCADDWFRSRDGCAREFPVEPEDGCALPPAIAGRLVSARDTTKAQCASELHDGVSPAPDATVTGVE